MNQSAFKPTPPPPGNGMGGPGYRLAGPLEAHKFTVRALSPQEAEERFPTDWSRPPANPTRRPQYQPERS